MQAKGWVKTDPGLKRENNQDSFLYEKNIGLFIVADGMGGHKGGEVASSMACTTVKDVFINPNNQHLGPRELIRFAYGEASSRIFEHAKENPELNGMGTTMVMSHFTKNTLFIANVGDSRCYLIRGNLMWQVTEDHSLMNEQIRAGILTPEQASKMVAKNVITRSVGFERDVACDVIERPVNVGETYLFCSDGLHGLVSDKRICEIVFRTPIELAPQVLIEEAKKNGGDDNITTLLLKITE
jgi:serine/threonine protein phosphatase PrpC